MKYICRYKLKGGVEDLKKARQYIDFLIDKYTDTDQLNLHLTHKINYPKDEE